MRWMRSLLLAVIAAAMLSGLAPGSIAASPARADTGVAGWHPAAEDQWLFELRTGRLRVGDGVRGYADGGAHVCVDLRDMIQALDLPIRVDTELRRATGWAFDERRTLEIDRDAGRVTIASHSQPLGADDIIDTPEGWCVSPDKLGEWLGVTIRADLSNSVIRLESPQPLPFELAAQRRARAAAIRPDTRFNLADMPQARRPYALWQTPSVDVVASASVTHDATARTTRRQTQYELFASGEALGASFDARLSSDNKGAPESLRVRAYRSDPDGNLLGPLHATHVAAGDVSSLSTPLAALPVMGRGAVVTNRPLDLPDSFDRTTFRGDLPVGWDAELYRNGQLIAFSEPGSDGRYEFVDVPLLYGLNQFEIVLYGPQGQVRRQMHSIPVGLEAIPPGKFYYWAGLLQENRDLLRLGGEDERPWRRGWRGSFGFERGINRRLSVAAWASTMLIDDRRYSTLEGSVRTAIGRTLAELTGSIQSNGGTATRLLWSGQFNQTYVTVESLLAHGGYRSVRVLLGLTGLHSVMLDVSPRIAGLVLPLHVEARYRQQASGNDRLEAAGRVSANWRNLSLSSELEWSRAVAATGPNGDSLALNLLANARFGGVRLRGEAHIGLSGGGGGGESDRAAVVAEWSASERTDWRTELGYEAGSSRVRGSIGYTRRFDALALGAYVEGATDGSVAAGLTLSFGFGPDPRRGGIRFSRERLAAQGQALATVFVDDNGDGVREAGEEAVRGVTLTAGSAAAEVPTDADGRAIVDALTPYRPVLIGVDQDSLPDPTMRPALAGVVVTPRPGVSTPVMIPLVASGEVEGTLVRDGGNGMEGVDIELVDQRGAVRATTRTDYDGYFLFDTVPYGDYRLRISALVAQALHIAPDLGRLTLSRANPRARMGALTVNARADLARAAPQQPPREGAR